MELVHSRPDHYAACAQKLRDIADECDDLIDKGQLLQIANEFEALAKSARNDTKATQQGAARSS
jgi:hypothetical protein